MLSSAVCLWVDVIFCNGLSSVELFDVQISSLHSRLDKSRVLNLHNSQKEITGFSLIVHVGKA